MTGAAAGGDAATRSPTSGMTYAVTRHATSRAGDPNPHDHVLIANVVEMLDDRGGFKGADTALWREHLHAATAYGRLRSARVAVELGYGIVPDRGKSGRLGHWAIAGIPDEAMAIHSKRSGQIDEVLGPGAATAYRERAIAARRTRTAKRHEPVEDLVERWNHELAAHGLDRDVIAATVGLAHRTRITGDLDDTALDRLAGRLLEADGRLAADKVFSRRDVIVAAAPHLFGLDPAVLGRLVDKVLAHPSAVELEPKPSASERMYAPRCVIDTERAIAERARDRHQLGTAPALLTALVDTTIRRTEADLAVKLTNSQRRAVTGVCTSGRSLDVIIGVAGAGKTTALRAVRDAYVLERRHVIATATSGQAARTVGHDAGIDSYTVASLLARLEHGSLGLDRQQRRRARRSRHDRRHPPPRPHHPHQRGGGEADPRRRRPPTLRRRPRRRPPSARGTIRWQRLGTHREHPPTRHHRTPSPRRAPRRRHRHRGRLVRPQPAHRHRRGPSRALRRRRRRLARRHRPRPRHRHARLATQHRRRTQPTRPHRGRRTGLAHRPRDHRPRRHPLPGR